MTQVETKDEAPRRPRCLICFRLWAAYRRWRWERSRRRWKAAHPPTPRAD